MFVEEQVEELFDRAKLESVLNPNKVEFSKSEKKVHAFVLNHPLQVVYESMESISKKIEVGEATVVRYFKKLGYNNFSSFKVAIYSNYESIKVSKNSPFIDNIMENMIDVIKYTKNLINLEAIEKATDYIMNSSKVFVAGMGISHTMAIDMFSKLIRIGIDALVLEDSHFSYMYTALLDEKAVVILYSFTGETVEIIKIAQFCKEKGIKIIVISNYQNSTLVQYADVLLQTRGFENSLNGGFFTSKISQIYISDVLVTNCALRDENKASTYNRLVANTVIK